VQDTVYIILVDITDLRIAEQTITQSHLQLRKLTSHLQKIREEERKFIAREIHDELGQLITALKIDIGFTNKKIKQALPQLSNRLEETMQLTDKLIKKIRRISTSLRPSLLDDIGLIAAIEWECKELQLKSGITCIFEKEEVEMSLSAEQKTNLYRIFQESITNIIRHANASFIKIKLQKKNKRIYLHVEDNGKGFDFNNQIKTLGILGMKERVTALNGEFILKTALQQGTIIVVKIPV
jgi:signal transduction histidine kinase